VTADDKEQEDAAQRALRRQRELDAIDFHLEISGQEPVRMRRFVSAEESLKAKRQRQAERDIGFLLQLASQQAIQQFQERLDELDRASKIALTRAEARILIAENGVALLRGRATRAPDGRLVYKTRDGASVFYEDETPVEDLDAINWRPGAPDWEDYKELRDTLDNSKRERDRIGEYRDRLDNVRGKVSSDSALSEDELSELQELAEDKPESIQGVLDEMSGPSKKSEAPGPTAPASGLGILKR
jgi:hypothetical protein